MAVSVIGLTLDAQPFGTIVTISMTTGGGRGTTPRNTSKKATSAAKAPTRTKLLSPVTTVGDPYKDTAGRRPGKVQVLQSIDTLIERNQPAQRLVPRVKEE